jgi:CRISPR-associated protein Cas1
MSTLLLDRAQLEVRSEGEALALYEAGERRGTVPVKLLERCIIQGAQTRLDSGVLLKLAEAGVATVLLSPRLGRRVAVMLGAGHNDAAVRLAQAQRLSDAKACLQWSCGLMDAKLRRQRKTLGLWLAARPDARKALSDAIVSVDTALQSVAALAGTQDNPHQDPRSALAALLGVEGAAARAHFSGLAAVVPPSLGFEGRNRRPPRDPVNACLSLGYTLLHVEAVQAAHSTGLDPMLGFYHRPSFGRESLASDLIEPLRASVDAWVWSLVRDRSLRAEHFTFDKSGQGACLLGKAGRAVFYASWAREVKPLRRWLRRTTAALARTLRDEGALSFSQDTEDESC